MRTHLKIKIKSLTAEARIIREEEWRFKKMWQLAPVSNDPEKLAFPHRIYDSLRHHRVTTVREEARSALLAYALLRRRLYQKVEDARTTKPVDSVRVAEILLRFAEPRHSLPQRKDDMVKFVNHWISGEMVPASN